MEASAAAGWREAMRCVSSATPRQHRGPSQAASSGEHARLPSRPGPQNVDKVEVGLV